MPQLQQLVTTQMNSPHVTNSGLAAVGVMNQLEILEMPWCSYVQDSTMLCVAQSCAKLHTVNLARCTL